MLIRNPFAFVRAVTYGFNGLLRPRAGKIARYIEQHSSLIADAIESEVCVEPTSRAPLLSAFAGVHNVARFELYGASRDYALRGNTGRYAWRKLFGPVTPAESQLHELAAVVNKTTGELSLYYYMRDRAPRQYFIERTLLFPRYQRAMLGLLFDAVQGNVRGNEARRLLVSMTLVGALIYVLLTALGR